MQFLKNNKSTLCAIFIAILLGIFEAVQTYIYREYDSRYMIEDILGASLGRTFLWIIIPLIIALISKMIFKKRFGNILLGGMIIISIPLSLMGSYGHYYQYSKTKTVSLPIVNSQSEKFKDIKKVLQQSMVPYLFSKQLDALISEGDKKTRDKNPGVRDYVFEGMTQRLKSVMQAMIWEQNGLMDKFDQIYAQNMTHDQIKRLLRFYENPLWKKMNSGESLSNDEKNALNEIYQNTFDENITSCTQKIISETETASKEWLKYALPRGKSEMNEYLKKFRYALDGYTLTRIE